MLDWQMMWLTFFYFHSGQALKIYIDDLEKSYKSETHFISQQHFFSKIISGSNPSNFQGP